MLQSTLSKHDRMFWKGRKKGLLLQRSRWLRRGKCLEVLLQFLVFSQGQDMTEQACSNFSSSETKKANVPLYQGTLYLNIISFKQFTRKMHTSSKRDLCFHKLETNNDICTLSMNETWNHQILRNNASRKGGHVTWTYVRMRVIKSITCTWASIPATEWLTCIWWH